MELKTQALDRALEALSPALAAELDRVVEETRQSLEQEFQGRLQSAVQDAEAAVRAEAEAQMALAVTEATEATKKQVTGELEEQFQSKLAATIEQLKNEASADQERLKSDASAEREQLKSESAAERDQLRSEAAAQREQLQKQVDEWRIFAETQRQLAEASSQPEILARFIKVAQPFTSGIGLYVTKADGLALWKQRGNGAFPEIISQQTTDPESYFKTVVVRGKIVAAVCAVPPFRADALDFLTSSLQQAIELFGLKLRAPAPKPLMASEKTTYKGELKEGREHSNPGQVNSQKHV